jgi:hypothetical protein
MQGSRGARRGNFPKDGNFGGHVAGLHRSRWGFASAYGLTKLL